MVFFANAAAVVDTIPIESLMTIDGGGGKFTEFSTIYFAVRP